MTSEERRQYMFALAELLEFQQMSALLRDEDPAILGPKLIRALSGSVDPAEESRNNSDGRNTMFELSLAAEWRRVGLNVAIGEPDITLTVGNQIFLVECKRPFTWPGIVSCLRHAFHLNLPADVQKGPQFALMSSLNSCRASLNEEALAIFTQAMSYGPPMQEEKSHSAAPS